MSPAVSEHDYDHAALARFELFLFAAVATVLITRAYLAATGYPQIGGGALHIAHVLWGGLLMAGALVGVQISQGSRARVRAALVGGIGFGLFIDEIGKFVTADVDYFFQPAIAIMYVVFVLFYLVVRELLLRRPLTDRKRLAVGFGALSDLALGQLDEVRYRSALRVVDGVRDPKFTDLAGLVHGGLTSQAPPARGLESRITHARDTLTLRSTAVLSHWLVRRTVLALFVLQAAASVVGVVVSLVVDSTYETDDVADLTVQLSSAVTVVLIVAGVWFLFRGPYLRSLRLLRASIVVNLLVTQVFLFAENQLGALTGFAFSLFLLAVLRIAIRTEEGAASAGAPEASASSAVTPA